MKYIDVELDPPLKIINKGKVKKILKILNHIKISNIQSRARINI